jgi:hypothetical protein
MTSLVVGGGILLLPPHPPTGSCTYVRLFWPTWSHGVGGVQLVDFTWCKGAWPPPHPSIGSPTRATICQYNFQFSIIFSKFKCQIKISNSRSVRGRCSESYKWNFKLLFISNTLLLKFISTVTSSYVLMFAYTTSDVYLTRRF